MSVSPSTASPPRLSISPPAPTPDTHGHRRIPTSVEEFPITNIPIPNRLMNQINAAAARHNARPRAAPNSVIESLPEISITSESDPSIVCPVCKDPFLVNSVANNLPCQHIYHSECIVPWLKINNSCPMCRSKLLTAEESKKELVADESYLSFLIHMHRHMERVRIQIQESEMIGIGDFDREEEDGIITARARPRWQMEEGAGGGGADEGGPTFE